jgi:tripartite-type tricarboxylate transporter receptor subunit TctC
MISQGCKTIVFIVCGVLAAHVSTVSPLWASSPYEGKSIRMIVPFSPGGGTDTYARLIARGWGRNIEGKPRFVVQNMTGAGGTIGFNYLYHRAKPDGFTIGVASAGIVLRQLIKFKGVQYDLRKMPLIANSGTTAFIFARGDIGVKTVADLKKLGRPVVTGGTSRGSVIESALKITLELFGVNRKPILGYPGYSAVRLALLRGEVDVTGDDSVNFQSNVKPLVENGDIVVLFQVGLLGPRGDVITDRTVAQIPTVEEVYVKEVGPLNSAQREQLSAVAALRSFGTSVFLPPGTSNETVGELREAFMKMQSDPRFIADFKKVSGRQDTAVPGEQGVAVLNRLLAASPQVVEVLK